MINKIRNYLKIVSIDILIYRKIMLNNIQFFDLGYDIQTENQSRRKKKYFIIENGVTVHRSILFRNLNILKLIQKKGPAIGDCYTNTNFRGKSIYPYVLCFILKEIQIENKIKEVFIIVNKDNRSSIKGIEKAGFDKFASIKAKRWLLFYFGKNILMEKNFLENEYL